MTKADSARRSRPGGALGARLGLILLCLLLESCGPKVRRAGQVPVVDNTDQPRLPASRVQRIESEERPTLQLVRRRGDPRPAVALAVFTPGGSADSLLLAALLRHRLHSPKTDPELSVHALGLVLSTEVSGPDGAAAFVDAAHRALTTPVTLSEVQEFYEGPLLEAARARATGQSPYANCMGQLGAEGAEVLVDTLKRTEFRARQQRLEALRTSTGAGQIGLSALGDGATLKAVAKAHERQWPQGEALADLWSDDEEVAVLDSTGGRELRIALRLDDSEAALGAARALGEENHPLRSRLASLQLPFVPVDTAVTLRPAGACLGMTLALEHGSATPTTAGIAEVAALVLDELRATARRSLTEEEQIFALLSPRGAREGAALAAWTAVRAAQTSTAWKNIIEYRAPEGEKVSPSRLSRALESTRKDWATRVIQTETRDESGQAELWMLLASTCGTSPEPADHAGLRALTVKSLASHFDGLHGVRLSPWISPTGVGLVAHGPPLRGESASRVAERVARVLGAALVGAEVDGRAVASERAHQLTQLGSDPGQALLSQILGAEHPSMLQPLGTESSVATLSTADVERARADLAREPLRLAILANATVSQGNAAQRALSHWLAPARAQVTTCPRVEPDPKPAGQWTLETVEEDVSPGAYIAVWAPGSPELGHATAFALNQPRGGLFQALDQPNLSSSAQASYFGGGKWGALVVRVAAEGRGLEPAVMQTRALLDRYAQGGMDPQLFSLARREQKRLIAAAGQTPEGRLVRLWLKPPPFSLTLEGLRSFQKSLAGKAQRVVIVEKR